MTTSVKVKAVPENASPPMIWTLLPMVTLVKADCKPSGTKNAEYPMIWTLLSMVTTSVKAVQPENAPSECK